MVFALTFVRIAALKHQAGCVYKKFSLEGKFSSVRSIETDVTDFEKEKEGSRKIQIDESVPCVRVTVCCKRCEEDLRARESKAIDRGRWTTRPFVPSEDRLGSTKMSGRRRVFSALNGLKCDRAIVWSVFLWCLVFLPGNVESAPPGICAMDECNCTVKAHRWVNVKCVFSNDQVNETNKYPLRD